MRRRAAHLGVAIPLRGDEDPRQRLAELIPELMLRSLLGEMRTPTLRAGSWPDSMGCDPS